MLTPVITKSRNLLEVLKQRPGTPTIRPYAEVVEPVDLDGVPTDLWQNLWPVFATSKTGTWDWDPDTLTLFGGVFKNTSATINDELQFENVALFEGTLEARILHQKSPNGGIVSVYWGVDKLGELDTWASSDQRNQIATINLGSILKGRKTLRLVAEGTSGTGYEIAIQQIQLTQPTRVTTGVTIDDYPWWIDVPPVTYTTCTGPADHLITQNSPFGSLFRSATEVGQKAVYTIGMPSGTYDVSILYAKRGSFGIAEWTLNGVSLGTVDHYAAVIDDYKLQLFSDQVIASKGDYTLEIECTGKHASSSNYDIYHAWAIFRRKS